MKKVHEPLVGTLAAVALVAALALFAPGGQGALAAPGIIYVDADAHGANDGTSWADAYTTLQPALDAAAPGDKIWVAEGTYKPDKEFIPSNLRSATFQLKNGVAIYGGFDPSVGATKFRDRDWVRYVTILSGDIGVSGFRFDNSYHVFYHPAGTGLDDSAILDGVTITGGTADAYDLVHTHGGGMYNDGSSPTLRNCTFEDNLAHVGGGGMYNTNSSSPALSNCTFAANTAFERGGGMFNDALSSPVLSDCTFEGNTAIYIVGGGGMANRGGSSPTLSNCTFAGNEAGSSGYPAVGGGMHNEASSPVLTGCTFFGNSAEHGGGMFNDDSSSPALTGCTFLDNDAGASGGGMYNYASAPTLTGCSFEGNHAFYGGGMFNTVSSLPVLADCIFEGNSASYHGGGMYNNDSAPTLANCIFSGNVAMYGGGMSNLGASPALTNCTFSGNEGATGGMHNAFYSAPTLTNCILWGDIGYEIYDIDSTPVVSYSDVAGDSTYPGTGNINAEPAFVDAANGDYHLLAGSPCIDAGSSSADLPPFDFEGDARILDGDGDGTAVVDMGVDEFVRVTILVEIDITPDAPNNVIRLRSGALVDVAILTTDHFDAGDVAHRTVEFAGAPVQHASMTDVNGDGEYDLVLSFFPADMEDLSEDSREATLTGFTDDGIPIQGTDRVKVIP